LKLIPVREIFYSIQGEGEYSGTPMVFVRLAGCNYSCPWCDTDYSAKTKMSPAAIAAEAILTYSCGIADNDSNNHIRVCITGGEPTIHDIFSIVGWLPTGCRVHVESNGSAERGVYDRMLSCGIHVVVSPKNKDGSAPESWRGLCSELKLVYQGQVLSRFSSDSDATMWLQPLHVPGDIAGNTERTKEVVSMCLENPPWRFSPQLQKSDGNLFR